MQLGPQIRLPMENMPRYGLPPRRKTKYHEKRGNKK
jgi:hypothetical protein